MNPAVRSIGAWVLAIVAGAASAQQPGEAPGAIPAAVPAGPRAPEDVSSVLAAILAKHDIPGMVVLVLHGREEVASGAAGVRKAGSPEAITIDDRFHIGSCTKSMTATLCAMLVEDGKLKWTTTLAEVYPELAEKMDPAWRAVTLEQLLTHRAGAPHELDKDGLWRRLGKREGTPTQQRAQLLEGVTKNPPIHAPGTKFEYSNAGVSMAGAMAERVTGKPWEELMRERLFEPLGMTSAGFGAPGTPGQVDQPWGHTAGGRAVSPGPRADNPAAIGPGGIVHCSIRDWGRYAALHLDGEHAERARLLGVKTFVKLHTPFDGPGQKYAMGWGVTERAWAKGPAAGEGGRVLTHSGSNTMWFAVVWLAPEKDYAVLAACNQGGDKAAKACDEAVGEMVKRHVQAAK